MSTERMSPRKVPRLGRLRETFDGLPPGVWEVHLLQQKTSWSARDHFRISCLTWRWTPAQRRRYEARWNWGRSARWH